MYGHLLEARFRVASRPGPHHGRQLIWLARLSIYALSVAALWMGDLTAASTHMRVIRHVTSRHGGLSALPPYVMESLLIGDKYEYFILTFAPHVLKIGAGIWP